VRETRVPITDPTISRTSREIPYDVTPMAPAAPVAAPVPNVTSAEQGNNLGTVFGNFFGGALNAMRTVREAENAADVVDIKRQNDVDQQSAIAKAIRGEALTPEEQANWNMVVPWKKTKAEVAASQDVDAFTQGPLKQMQLGDMTGSGPMVAQYVGEKLKGNGDKTFGDFYTAAFMRLAQPKIDAQKANLLQAQRILDRDDARAAATIEIKQGLANTPEWISKQIDQHVAIAGPAQAPEARNYAISAIIEDAAKAGKLDGVIAALQQKVEPTADNPTGLSWAERYPSAVDNMVQKARNDHSDTYNQAATDKLHQIDLAIKAHDIEVAPGVTGVQRAAQLMAEYGQQFSKTDARYMAMEGHFVTVLNAQAKKLAAVSRLTGASSDGVYSPKDVNEVGGDVLKQYVSAGRWDKAAALISQWGVAPKDWITSYANQIADTSRSNTAAAILDQGFMSLYRLAPEIVKREVGQDAEQVLDFVKAEQDLGNHNTVEAVTRAHAAQERIRKNGLNPADVVMYDQSSKTGRQDLEDTLRTKLVGAVAPEYQGFLERNVPGTPNVVVDGEVLKSFHDLVKSRFIFNREAMGYDRAKALDAAIDSAKTLAGARLVAVPSPDGNLVLKPDISPDTAVKMRPVKGPEGTTMYDPVAAFREQSSRGDLGFVGGGQPLGLDADKRYTPVDGSYKVVKPGGFPVVFAPGQSLTWDVSGPMGPDGEGTKETRTVKLADDPELAKAQLNELFKGTLGMKLSADQVVFMGGNAVPTWQLLFQPTPPGLPSPETKELTRGFELNQTPQGPQKEGLVDRLNRTGGYADWQGNPAVKLPGVDYDGGGKFIKQTTDSLVSYLRDKGMFPGSATKPVPENFTDAKDAWGWVMDQMESRKLKLGNLPLEANDTPIEQRYITARRQFLEANEGRRYEVYKDTKGLKTIGIGFNMDDPTVRGVMAREGLDVRALLDGKAKMNDDEINRVFDTLITGAEKVVSDKVKVPITAQQRLALVSLAYNNPSLIGPKLTEAINSGNKQAALNEVLTNSDLKGSYRRQREADYLSMGNWPA
jgi:GH24 family phage-related lysozyme (muramidase)